MQFIQERRRLVLLVLVVLVLLCLVIALAVNQFSGGGDGVAGDTPTPPPTPTDEGPVVIVTPGEEDEDEATPTPTRVIVEEPDEEPTPSPEPTEVAAEPTTEATPPTGADFVPSPPDFGSSPAVFETDNILKNGGFDEGFDDLGVGVDWQHFTTDGAIISFSGETFDTLIQDGSSAQRISVDQAFQTDRYAGIYQTLEVVPNQPYTLTIYGQARTYYGDVSGSGYGYRVQYAVDFEGGDDWQKIPEADWVELPWGEEALDSSDPAFSEFSTEITPTSDQMTLFIRTWNKWPDPKLVEYTFDSLSLVGPVPGSAIASTTTSTSTITGTTEAMIDQPLPVTGTESITSFMSDARFWGALLVLLLLATGAVYRARWRW